jgi:hypothetical protein
MCSRSRKASKSSADEKVWMGKSEGNCFSGILGVIETKRHDLPCKPSQQRRSVVEPSFTIEIPELIPDRIFSAVLQACIKPEDASIPAMTLSRQRGDLFARLETRLVLPREQPKHGVDGSSMCNALLRVISCAQYDTSTCCPFRACGNSSRGHRRRLASVTPGWASQVQSVYTTYVLCTVLRISTITVPSNITCPQQRRHVPFLLSLMNGEISDKTSQDLPAKYFVGQHSRCKHALSIRQPVTHLLFCRPKPHLTLTLVALSARCRVMTSDCNPRFVDSSTCCPLFFAATERVS